MWGKLKIIKKISVLATILIIVCAVPAPANAAVTEQDISQKLTSYGVSQSTSQILIQKLQAGEIWESLDENAVPISTNSIRINGFDETIDTFSDGSIGVTKSEVPTSALSRASLSKCQTSSGTGYVNYSNCLVVRDAIVFLMAFTTDFSIHPGPYNDTISRVYNPYFGSCFIGCSELTLNLNQKIESATSPANARLQMTFEPMPLQATTVWVDLQVGCDKVILREG
jgi:hypothetical protein